MDSPAPLPDVANEVVRRVQRREDLVSMFCTRAETVGMRVRRIQKADLCASIKQCLSQVAGDDRCRVIVETDIDHEVNLASCLTGVAECIEPPRDDDTLFEVDAAITGVACAIAETGTLACERKEHRRCQTSLIPPVHIAIVPAAKILPDLLDFFGDSKNVTDSSNVSLITGPSKTADIEGILITGVHGPRHVFVFVLED